jgi:sodium/potassium-transporting ATPase subunit alpha
LWFEFIKEFTHRGNLIFGTAPIDLKGWLFMLPFALGLWLLEEGRKWLMSKVGRRVDTSG